VLKAAGSASDVVASRVYISDQAAFQDMNKVYQTYFPTDPPARATVKALLTSPDYIVEITMVAVKGSNRSALTTPNADGTAGTKNPNLSAAIRAGIACMSRESWATPLTTRATSRHRRLNR
jgi:Putative translation initiation inhibitor, yjgF family